MMKCKAGYVLQELIPWLAEPSQSTLHKERTNLPRLCTLACQRAPCPIRLLQLFRQTFRNCKPFNTNAYD
jgi:hypothetical protein